MIRILIVDSEPMRRSLFRVMLRQLDVEIVEADSESEAMGTLHDFLPDVILLSTRAPGSDCIQCVATLKGEVTTRTIPILIVGNKMKYMFAEKLRNSGAEMVLNMPFGPQLLCDAVENLLSIS